MASARSLHLSLSRHFFFACSSPPLYLCLFDSSTPLPYFSTYQVACLSYLKTVSLNFTFFIDSSFLILSMWPNHHEVFLFTNSTNPYITPYACVPTKSLKYLDYSQCPILTLSMPPLGSSFLHHTLLTDVPYSTFLSLIHTSLLVKCSSLNSLLIIYCFILQHRLGISLPRHSPGASILV